MDKQTLIVAVIASLPGFLVALVAIVMTRPNRNKVLAEAEASNADAVKSYALATTSYAVEVTRLRDEIKVMRGTVDERDALIDERDALIKELRIQMDDLKDWATRLVHQVRSLGKKPVPFRQTGNPVESA